MGNGATRTAVGPIAFVAVDQRDGNPLVRDELAQRFLPAGVRPLVALTRFRPVRRWLINATERKMPGIWASTLCRKCYIDDRFADAVSAGVEAVVILGAGFDTRAHRQPDPQRTRIYEVDLPENIDRKRNLLRGRLGESVALVPVDLESGELPAALSAHGYRPEQPTLFIAEAVTPYMAGESVRAMFEFLGSAATGSRLVCTFLREDFLDGTSLRGGEALHEEYVVRRKLWRFGLDPEQIGDFLAGYGWRQVEQLGPQEYADRYLAPAGRSMPVAALETAVYAEKD
ncbi:SAM-dependent methyltransferase [Saccharopolyspora sp. ASAGF58]|uniref:SAM-dependent methyltransferase n=1 Tax=Saccharopolyspora sp. ASAGF58 TaxID=2719023 RepID=UPI00143FCC09|nr:SAM-dependent methyltransferase [Saccharopolyspora sp. ASAGF58]QIZ39039.1 SAM-dependent methyltransferase [Saccharopolyspora sp. ASAGF58]